MKLVFAVLVVASYAIAQERCPSPLDAIEKGIAVSDAIAGVNGFDVTTGESPERTKYREFTYWVIRSYDTKPGKVTYTVRVSDEGCLVKDVNYLPE